MSCILFLDMDDVLCISRDYNSVQMMLCIRSGKEDSCPDLWQGLVDRDAATNLHTLHDEFAPTYVISSSWASYLDREQMCDVLTRTNLDFVRDNLHRQWRTPRGRSTLREAEIAAWIEDHKAFDQMLVIDDTESGWSLADTDLMRAGRVVLCDAWVGFTNEKLTEARKLLRALSTS